MLATKVSVDCKIPIDNVKSRFIEMFQNSNYSCVHLSDVLNQYYVPEKIDKPELESYITLSSYGKGIKKREIKEGKTPVPFTGCRIKAGQFISSRLHAKEGAFGLVPEELDGFVVSRDFPVFDIDINQINPKYLLAAVSHESFYQQFLNDSFGSTTKRRIKENIFLEYSIVLPPLDKQNEYVSFLEHIGHIRTMLKRYLYLLDSLVKSRFIELFGSCDKVPLTNLARVVMGQSPESSSYNDQNRGIPFFQGKAEFGEIFVSVNLYCNSPKKVAKPMDILMSVRAPVGSVNITPLECCIGRGLAALSPKNDVNVWFLFYALRMIECEISNLGVGSTFKAISKSNMNEILVPSPSIELQNQFADFVRQVDKSKFTCRL